VAYEALCLLEEEHLVERSAELGAYMIKRLRALHSPLIKEVRGKGLWIGVELHEKVGSAWNICIKMLSKGILMKDTHQTTIRFAPPLIITQGEVDFVLNAFEEVLREVEEG
jgi:ornithine--oxo-acid transaminase